MAISIPIISDETIYSGPGGEQLYTWSSQATWRQALGSGAVRTYVSVVAVSSDPVVTVVGQWSLDGRNWTPFDQVLTQPATITAVGNSIGYYAGNSFAYEFGPFVRFGVGIADGTSGTQEYARCTVTLVLDGPGGAAGDVIAGTGAFGNPFA